MYTASKAIETCLRYRIWHARRSRVAHAIPIFRIFDYRKLLVPYDNPLNSFIDDDRPYHVEPADGGGWNVKLRGSDRITRHFNRKKEAVDFGCRLAKARGLRVVIHRADGRVMQQYDYSVQRYRSKGTPVITSGFGGARGLIHMEPDFDEPPSVFDS